MRNMLAKEFLRSLHPTAFIFLSLSAMLLIPNYSYYVTFFYTGLAVFFTCLGGRENRDIAFSMNLPVRKSDIVGARFLAVVALESAQITLAIPCAVLRQAMPVPNNQAGIEANIAFFGISLLLLGVFNFAFFVGYYRDVRNVGRSFAISSAAVFLVIVAAEACVHTIPFAKIKLDTMDPAFMTEKLVVLVLGAVCYIVLTLAALRISVRSFERQDLQF